MSSSNSKQPKSQSVSIKRKSLEETPRPPKTRGQRPLLEKFPELGKQICKFIEEGATLKHAAQTYGVAPPQIYVWLEKARDPNCREIYKKFAELFNRAYIIRRKSQEKKCEDAVFSDKVERKEKQVIDRKGNIVTLVEVTRTGPDPRVMIDYLSRLYPDTWARTSRIEAHINIEEWMRKKADEYGIPVDEVRAQFEAVSRDVSGAQEAARKKGKI